MNCRKGTHKTDLLSLYDLNVFLAKRFNELKLLINVVFCHPPGKSFLKLFCPQSNISPPKIVKLLGLPTVGMNFKWGDGDKMKNIFFCVCGGGGGKAQIKTHLDA